MRKSSATMWHAALLLLIFSMINLAATPFSFAAGMAVRAIKNEGKYYEASGQH